MKSVFTKLFVLLTFAIILQACQDSNTSKQYVEQAKMVKTAELTKFDGYIERHITGRLQAADTTALSFEVNGVVKNVYVNLGEAFTKGQLLAELDDQIFQLAVNQRESLLAEAKAARTEAQQSLTRNLSLKKQNLVSQAVVDNAQAAFDIANQRVNSAQSALNIDKENLSDTKLYAPYNGTISDRLIEPSQQISVQTPAFTIQGDANLEVAAAISESLIGRIELGEQVTVKIPALSSSSRLVANTSNTDMESAAEIKFAARLTEIGTQASIANAFPITITFTQNYPSLRPGMSAEILLPIKEDSSQNLKVDANNGSPLYEIPLSAIATDAKGQYVHIIRQIQNDFVASQVHFDIVQTLPKSVLARLPIAHDKSFQVVTAGVEFLNDGQLVMPLNKSQQIYNQ